MPRPGTEITREQLDILRNKFDLLKDDRKAYFETYEATKKANDQLLREVRDLAGPWREAPCAASHGCSSMWCALCPDSSWVASSC